MISKTFRNIGKAGCLVLFSLPFAAVGVFMFRETVLTLLKNHSIQQWKEVPATILETKLETHSDDDGDTYKVTAKYSYTFRGKNYIGNVVTPETGSDNIGSFHQKAFQTLDRHKKNGKPYRCFVNPKQPNEAVLFRKLRWEMLAFKTLFSMTFGAVGFGLLTGGINAAWKDSKNQPNEPPPDDQPWLQRTDWAEGKAIEDSSSLLVPFVLAAWLTVSSLPLLSTLPHQILDLKNYYAFFGLIALVAVAISWKVYFKLQKQRKNFGETYLRLADVPGVIGGKLAGVVQFQNRVEAIDGFKISLACYREESDGDGDTNKIAIWQDEVLVSKIFTDEKTGGMAIPFLFAIPYNMLSTNEDRGISWYISVQSTSNSVQFKAKYEVPVYTTEASRKDFALDRSLAASVQSKTDPKDVLTNDGIESEPTTNGMRFFFPAKRNRKTAVFLTILFTIWTGVCWFLWLSDVPFIFALFFTLLDCVLFVMLLFIGFSSGYVEASPDGLRWCFGLFGMGKEQFLARTEIRRFYWKWSMSSSDQLWYTLYVSPKIGKAKRISGQIKSRHVERALIHQLEKALGEKIKVTYQDRMRKKTI